VTINHYGAGPYRVAKRYDWRTLDYYYYATREDARVGLGPGERVEAWDTVDGVWF
jgi:hypothetical protein